MKKLVLGVIALGILTVSAYAVYGVLEGEDSDGYNKTCYYSNGQTITVLANENCPVSSH